MSIETCFQRFLMESTTIYITYLFKLYVPSKIDSMIKKHSMDFIENILMHVIYSMIVSFQDKLWIIESMVNLINCRKYWFKFKSTCIVENKVKWK
jgi:hypothetical protein